jgi:hypothetical protein
MLLGLVLLFISNNEFIYSYLIGIGLFAHGARDGNDLVGFGNLDKEDTEVAESSDINDTDTLS